MKKPNCPPAVIHGECVDKNACRRGLFRRAGSARAAGKSIAARRCSYFVGDFLE
jgi:hypothetical protein